MSDEKMVKEVLDYLHNNPNSGDTLEGIARWWMLRQRLSESVDAIQQALEQLKREGAVFERKTTSGRTIYFASEHSEGRH